MKRAMELADIGKGYVSPNPCVGAVVVLNNQIIAEGYHKKYGQDHAERMAIKSCPNVEGATLYVTLEPCCHQGKTPPCTDLIIESKIKKVIIGILDPNPLVAGKGVKQLNDAGIITEVTNDPALIKQNEVFMYHMVHHRPYIVLKYAMSLDGKIATSTGDSKWITGEDSRQYVHQLRHEYDGILVGVNTVLSDDPYLTTRGIKHGQDPHRIILDTHGRTPEKYIYERPTKARTIICLGEHVEDKRVKGYLKNGFEVIQVPLLDGQLDTHDILKRLYDLGIYSVLIEGGATIHGHFMDQKLVNKVICFVAPKMIGGHQALSPIGGEGISLMDQAQVLDDISLTTFESDFMIEGYLRSQKCSQD